MLKKKKTGGISEKTLKCATGNGEAQPIFHLFSTFSCCLHLCACAVVSFSPVQATKVRLVTRGVFYTKPLSVADQRPDDVGVEHVCVASYITLHALVCFPSGCFTGDGERKGGGCGLGYLLDSIVTMSLPQQFSKHIINTRLGARALKY